MQQENNIQPIFVTGVARSGASLITRIIAGCEGVKTGMHPFDLSKMYENKRVKKLVSDYYSLHGYDESGQHPLPNPHELAIPTNWRKCVLDCLGVKEGETFVYKDHRIAQTWRLWHYSFPEAKFIIVRRKRAEIAQSCVKTTYMTLHSSKKEWLEWIVEQEKNLIDMISEGIDCKVIWPHRMVYGDFQQIYQMLKWLSLEWHDKIVSDVSPLLQKTRDYYENYGR